MNIVITDLDHADQNMERDVFGKAGMDFQLLECKTEDDLINQIPDANIALNQYAPFTKRVFDALPNLKQIIRYGVGREQCRSGRRQGSWRAGLQRARLWHA